MKPKFKESMKLFGELLIFMKIRKTYFLAPLLFVLFLLAWTFCVLEGSAFLPYIYAIF